MVGTGIESGGGKPAYVTGGVCPLNGTQGRSAPLSVVMLLFLNYMYTMAGGAQAACLMLAIIV